MSFGTRWLSMRPGRADLVTAQDPYVKIHELMNSKSTQGLAVRIHPRSGQGPAPEAIEYEP
ncbi:hypothetical protein N7444_009200 [Penicillium canescens]|nr:hypothetical protein N7444_009200 [Penicillium canescens]